MGCCWWRFVAVTNVMCRLRRCYSPIYPHIPTQVTAGLLRHAARGGGAVGDAEIKADVERSLAWLEAATKPL